MNTNHAWQQGDNMQLKYLHVGFLTTVCLIFAGCGSLAPSLEEDTALIAAAGLDATQRYAVVSNGGFASREVANPDFAQPVVDEIATITGELLGVEAIGLDQSPDGDWAREMKESWDEAGFFEVIDHFDFFESRGFDGYVIFMQESEVLSSDGPFLYERFQPQFRIYQLHEGGTRPLMRTGQSPAIECDQEQVMHTAGGIPTRRFKDPIACAWKFAEQYRKDVSARVRGGS